MRKPKSLNNNVCELNIVNTDKNTDYVCGEFININIKTKYLSISDADQIRSWLHRAIDHVKSKKPKLGNANYK